MLPPQVAELQQYFSDVGCIMRVHNPRACLAALAVHDKRVAHCVVINPLPRLARASDVVRMLRRAAPRARIVLAADVSAEGLHSVLAAGSSAVIAAPYTCAQVRCVCVTQAS